MVSSPSALWHPACFRSLYCPGNAFHCQPPLLLHGGRKEEDIGCATEVTRGSKAQQESIQSFSEAEKSFSQKQKQQKQGHNNHQPAPFLSPPTHLVVGEHPEGVQLNLGGQARAGAVSAGDDARNKGAMAQPIIQSGLVSPVGALPASACTGAVGWEWQ